jgi:hypothetical protein
LRLVLFGGEVIAGLPGARAGGFIADFGLGCIEVKAGMELVLATKKANARGALAVASRQLLLLLALGYLISYIVPACINFAFLQVNEEANSSAIVPGAGLKLPAELVCEPGLPRLWERSACNLPK